MISYRGARKVLHELGVREQDSRSILKIVKARSKMFRNRLFTYTTNTHEIHMVRQGINNYFLAYNEREARESS